MSTSGKTGFYFRVLQEGYVDQDDDLELIQLADGSNSTFCTRA